jgi:hypothetical protein
VHPGKARGALLPKHFVPVARHTVNIRVEVEVEVEGRGGQGSSLERGVQIRATIPVTHTTTQKKRASETP